jgi:VanZ family protein
MAWVLTTILTAVVTLGLCWWPFNFRSKNDVLLAPDQGTAFFNMGLAAPVPYSRGHAFTRDTIQFDSNLGASFHFLLTPSDKPKGLGSILALHDGGKQPPFVIAQWQEHLALFVRDPETKKGYREVGLRDQLKIGKTISLDLVTTSTETNVFVDGQPMAHYAGFSLLGNQGLVKGQLLIGNNQHGTEPWHGRLQRVIVHDRANGSFPNQTPANRPVVDYNFTTGNDENVINQGNAFLSLDIPECFTPRVPIFLASLSRKEFNRIVTRHDVALNILGFMPISICFAVLSRSVQGKPGRLFILTVMLAFFFSLLIEAVQYFLPSRHSSQLDLLCNTAGGVLVASVFLIKNRKAHSLPSS